MSLETFVNELTGSIPEGWSVKRVEGGVWLAHNVFDVLAPSVFCDCIISVTPTANTSNRILCVNVEAFRQHPSSRLGNFSPTSFTAKVDLEKSDDVVELLRNLVCLPPGDEALREEDAPSMMDGSDLSKASLSEAVVSSTSTSTDDSLGIGQAKEVSVTGEARIENGYSVVEVATDFSRTKQSSCDICGKSFASDWSRRNHRASVHCVERRFHCKECPYKSNTKHRLGQHVRVVHREQKPIKCRFCDHMNKNAQARWQHERLHGSASFCCDFKDCGKSFHTRGKLTAHQKRHSNDRPFPCPDCDQRYKRRQNLRRHAIRSHGEPQHKCGDCGKAFAFACELTTHASRKHDDAAEKPAVCHICGKGFWNRFLLEQHLRSHSGERPFQCRLCSKTFATKSHLTDHAKQHSENPKPFSCAECPSAFGKKTTLTDHVRIHSGEKPFACSFCPKRFRQTATLNKHRKSVHRAGPVSAKSGAESGTGNRVKMRPEGQSEIVACSLIPSMVERIGNI